MSVPLVKKGQFEKTLVKKDNLIVPKIPKIVKKQSHVSLLSKIYNFFLGFS